MKKGARSLRRRFIVRIDTYHGDTSSLQCTHDGGFTEAMYCIILVQGEVASIVDCGYRSIEEAAAAWPDAHPCAA